MSELKPCKKCGWEHPRRIIYGNFQGRQDTYRITCPNCSYCTKEKSSVSEAIEAWNRRQEMDKLEPCPFCGGTKIWIGTIAECEMQDKNHPDYEFNSEHYVAVCDYSEGGCGASTGGSARTKEDAIKLWNRRDNNDRT